MNEEATKRRLEELKNYLNKNWKGLSDNFEGRLIARAEYDRLLKQLQNHV